MDAKVAKMNEMLADRKNAAKFLGNASFKVLEFDSTNEHPFIALLEMAEGYYRVVQAVAYLNRSNNVQITVFMGDFDTLGEAEDLWLRATTSIVIFGSEFRISRGSGMRLVATHNEAQTCIRVI